MAGMFYSLQETAQKLGKTEEQVKQMVQDGKLREFRDGANLLFRVEDGSALLPESEQTEPELSVDGSSIVGGSSMELSIDETGEISLAPEEEQVDLPGLSGSDTKFETEGINVLGDTDKSDYDLTEDAGARRRPRCH